MHFFSWLKRYSFHAGHYLFAGVLLLRFLSIARLSVSPFLLPTRGDMHFYNDWAHRVLQGELTSQAAFYGLPGYAYLLAGLYKVFGYSPLVPAVLQASLDAGTAVLIYNLAFIVLRPVFSHTEPSTTGAKPLIASHLRESFALAAGIGWAFFVPAQAYSIILMPTAWATFVFWFVVWRIVKDDVAPTLASSWWLGLLVGITAMGIATVLFIVPLTILAILVRSQRFRRGAIISALLLLLGVGVGTAPCWIHNYFVARDPVVLSAHGGINFWIGNNPDANGYPHFPPGMRAGQAAMLEDSINTAETAAGHRLKRGEVSRYWSAKAKDYIAAHPTEWLSLLAKKIRNFWSAFQYDDLSIITILREHGVIFPGLYFGMVAALALPGIVFGWKSAPRSRWIACAVLLQMTALLPVFVTERYRLPVVPALLVFAALGLSILWRALGWNQGRVIALYLLFLTIGIGVVAWPQNNPSLRALDAYNAGWQALESNNLPLAERKLTIARAYVPTNTETNFAFGNLRLAQKDEPSAVGFYRETLRIDPNHKGALNNLGLIALDNHRLPEAQMYFERALAQDRHQAKTYFLLAKTAMAAGDLDNAEREIDTAVGLSSGQPEFIALKNEIQWQKQAR